MCTTEEHMSTFAAFDILKHFDNGDHSINASQQCNDGGTYA